MANLDSSPSLSPASEPADAFNRWSAAGGLGLRLARTREAWDLVDDASGAVLFATGTPDADEAAALARAFAAGVRRAGAVRAQAKREPAADIVDSLLDRVHALEALVEEGERQREAMAVHAASEAALPRPAPAEPPKALPALASTALPGFGLTASLHTATLSPILPVPPPPAPIPVVPTAPAAPVAAPVIPEEEEAPAVSFPGSFGDEPDEEMPPLPAYAEAGHVEPDEEDEPALPLAVPLAATSPEPLAGLPVPAPLASYFLPQPELLAAAPTHRLGTVEDEVLDANARLLESVLQNFGIKGEIVDVCPGPVVTLYEFEPAPGIKSSRVIGLAEDIARSMSVVAVRIAVVPGRSVIGIELPNPKREMVYLEEMLRDPEVMEASARLPLMLGKDIGGKPVVADLARMPHLLIAGTTGSGKSVGINTMILSLLFRNTPRDCRFILIDPKMLELSVYDGIPHLLAPVVTDPKKAVVALKWAVKEMEDRYRAMAQLGVRNIEGYNGRLDEIEATGERPTRRVPVGIDKNTGQPILEDRPIDLDRFPYIVVVVDEMADLMLVAGKEIESAIQRLAQMARAAGIHLIMATQRPSVDVITGTIKANFPTRISFQVTSKIDSRTILGDAGAEQLLGQGDMLYMTGGGRIVRVHGPFVSDQEVEQVVSFLKAQGSPVYEDGVTFAPEEEEAGGRAAGGGPGPSGDGPEDELYDQAVALVIRERKASTSFIQRYLQIGYNRAARLVERMELDGVVSQPNHVGKREILISGQGGGDY